ncbi:hypothetical protein TROLL_274 [Bacillus phage Troll]|uniref:Uncharacterized protein n=1 Tax=Bacillus phage Troll TaxID=1382932 RepID=S5Z833_9CAUD|nr:hypothetical protein TROLL_274 [Bacillus phage Troll]AGT13621.1 hypothetical protein TROLL_274 [Bacillus phage Troll]
MSTTIMNMSEYNKARELIKLHKQGEYTQLAFKIAVLYDTQDFRYISNIMEMYVKETGGAVNGY